MSYAEDILNGLALLFFTAGAAMLYIWLKPDAQAHLRHCPECGHDLRRAVGHACPECGRSAPDELPFHRPHRRWKLVSGIVAAGVLGAACMWVAPWPRVGWAYYAPNVALIMAYPEMDRPTSAAAPCDVQHRPVYMRLYVRLASNDLPGWQRRWLSARLANVAQTDRDPVVRAEALALIGLCRHGARDVIPALIQLTTCGDPTIEARARGALMLIDPRRPDVMRALVGDPTDHTAYHPFNPAEIPLLRDDGLPGVRVTYTAEVEE